MAQGRPRLPGRQSKALDELIDRALSDLDLTPDDRAREALKQKLTLDLANARDIEVDYEIKVFSLFSIRHKARIGASSSRAKLLVLLLPSLMLILAIAGAVALIWILSIFHRA